VVEEEREGGEPSQEGAGCEEEACGEGGHGWGSDGGRGAKWMESGEGEEGGGVREMVRKAWGGGWWWGDGGEECGGGGGGILGRAEKVVMEWGWRRWGALVAESRGRWRGRGGGSIFRPGVTRCFVSSI